MAPVAAATGDHFVAFGTRHGPPSGSSTLPATAQFEGFIISATWASARSIARR
jgi:hypothetical protein